MIRQLISPYLPSIVTLCGAIARVSCCCGHRAQQHAVTFRKKQLEKIQYKAYQKVIPLVTHGNVRLVTPDQYKTGYNLDNPMLRLKIASKQDIASCRSEVDSFFSNLVPGWKDVRRPILLCLSEAVTNVVKHTPGGQVLVFLDPSGPRFHVEDNGTGLELDNLPSMVLHKGFSTISSLGMGFTIMTRYMKQIVICSSSKGTMLVLHADLGHLLS